MLFRGCAKTNKDLIISSLVFLSQVQVKLCLHGNQGIQVQRKLKQSLRHDLSRDRRSQDPEGAGRVLRTVSATLKLLNPVFIETKLH